MKKILPFIIALTFVSLNAQDSKLKEFDIIDLAVELQASPTGIIPGITLSTNLTSRDALSLRLAANLFDNKDLAFQAGINNHKSEKGFGYGASLGIKHYFLADIKKLYGGFRLDIWKNEVQWSNNIYSDCEDCINENNGGISELETIQPSIMLGWLVEFGKNKNFFISPEIALAYEWNASVKGEETYYGPKFLVGVSLGYRNSKKVKSLDFIEL